MNSKISYAFSANVWQHAQPSGWYFLSLPTEMATEIRENLKWQEEGWGRMKATARIGDTEWKTAIWFDTKKETYLLPLKGEVRKKEKLQIGERIEVTLWL